MEPVQLIQHDHQTIERLFKRMERVLSSEAVDDREPALSDLTRELSIHAAIEEQILYPTLRKLNNEDAVLDAVEEHHAVKLTLAELQATDPDDPRFASKARLLIQNVRQHIHEEESELLPQLERSLDSNEARDLASALANARVVSPTRPHASSPEFPPGNLVIGPFLAIVDRLRDSARDAVVEAGEFAGSAVRTLLFILRRLSTQAERRGRDAVGALAHQSRAAVDEVSDVSRRTFEQATGRSLEAARQLRVAPARARQRASARRNARGRK